MNEFFTVLLLAVGLAMDAFSVSVSYGVCQPKAGFLSCLRIPFFTGIFQFFMPILGWLGGSFIGGSVQKFDHWIAFLIFTAIGIKMILDSFLKKNECKPVDISKGSSLIILSIATSVDAFAAGFSLGILKMPLLFSAGLIGAVTFLISISGVYLGRFAGFVLGRWAEVIGGAVLIFLGIKHLIL